METRYLHLHPVRGSGAVPQRVSARDTVSDIFVKARTDAGASAGASGGGAETGRRMQGTADGSGVGLGDVGDPGKKRGGLGIVVVVMVMVAMAVVRTIARMEIIDLRDGLREWGGGRGKDTKRQKKGPASFIRCLGWAWWLD